MCQEDTEGEIKREQTQEQRTETDSMYELSAKNDRLNFYGEAAVNIPAIMCAVFISSLPVIIAYFSAQEQISNGLTQGAVKG